MAAATVTTLQKTKQCGEKFSCITAYDAMFAATIEQAGIETILVGDSLGMVLQGHSSTLPVTVSDMAYHTACVAQGAPNTYIIADMPFMSYSSPDAALDTAKQLMQAGAHIVKLEGGQWLCSTIEQLNQQGVPVCGHLGLTPQSVNKLGGYKIQGRADGSAEAIMADAIALEQSGIELLVLECIPAELAEKITQRLTIPTIGIGAGNNTDAQVLVLHDMLGLNPKPAKFVKNFMAEADSIEAAIRQYGDDTRAGIFPTDEHSFS